MFGWLKILKFAPVGFVLLMLYNLFIRHLFPMWGEYREQIILDTNESITSGGASSQHDRVSHVLARCRVQLPPVVSHESDPNDNPPTQGKSRPSRGTVAQQWGNHCRSNKGATSRRSFPESYPPMGLWEWGTLHTEKVSEPRLATPILSIWTIGGNSDSPCVFVKFVWFQLIFS